MNDLTFQIALFPKKPYLHNPSELVADVSRAVKSSSNMELTKQNIFPQSIQEAPGIDIPRVIAATENDSIIFQANDKKINFTFQTFDENNPPNKDDFWVLVEKLLGTQSLSQIDFKRLGFIRTSLATTENFTPYAERILLGAWHNKIENFNMQLGYKKLDGDFNLNINISIGTGFQTGTQKKAVQLQVDVNTLAEDDISQLGNPIDILKQLSNGEVVSEYTDALSIAEA